jgi:metal-sulfur cluster biosynthetic enzyme
MLGLFDLPQGVGLSNEDEAIHETMNLTTSNCTESGRIDMQVRSGIEIAIAT